MSLNSVTGQAIIDKGKIKILDKDLLNIFKKSRHEGNRLRFTFETWQNKRSEEAHRYFHVLRDSYSAATGYNKEYAKIELKYFWGIKILYNEHFKTPIWSGRFAEYPAEGVWIYFFKSITTYTKKEMNLIIEGTIKTCIEVGADIEELIEDYKNDKS